MSQASGWQQLSRARTYELVLDQVEEKIVSGELRVGDRLPPERDLASALGVSRPAVREALRVLEAQGVLRRPQVGTGRDSGSIIAGTPSIGLSRLLRIHVALSNFDLGEIVEARITMERASVTLAASDATPKDLAQMRYLLDRMDDESVTREEFNDLDTEFHVALAEAAGNRLIATMTTAIRGAIRHDLLNVFSLLTDWETVAGRLRADHRRIYEAVEAGDGKAAADRVEEHIRGFYQDVALKALR
ncbi:FadR family transcriptional regulator [Streptomyces durbertensis]|uniref:FadR family transcriptional regulator n=1 Tax=Streptomyces durbertensis TaxID=2448886 RepID=A0ABR6EA87_9ACTN|nr:FCD domain-containing protein [Streptomyces durbertensis]MBB1242255.1 FadR family transcriptional regulator [Streptomyces durbertensis]